MEEIIRCRLPSLDNLIPTLYLKGGYLPVGFILTRPSPRTGQNSAARSASPSTDEQTGDHPRADHQRRLFFFRGEETGVDYASFQFRSRRFRKKRPLAASNDDLSQPSKAATGRKPTSIKDVAFRRSFGLGPEKTENQGPNREKMAGGWGKSMMRRGALEGCETVTNPLEARGKRKPTPRRDGVVFY